jgi:hypothetical protein
MAVKASSMDLLNTIAPELPFGNTLDHQSTPESCA